MSEATEPPVLTGLDDGSILIRAHGEGQWFMPSDKLRKVLFDLDLATMRGEEIRRLRAENERLESVIRNSDAALSDEYIGLMRGHLAEVGIEATFADDVAALAKHEIRKLREENERLRSDYKQPMRVPLKHGPATTSDAVAVAIGLVALAVAAALVVLAVALQ